ncbi:glutaredoxin family protein [Methylogaea oryzae]|nr:glutaredoxin family protein [Methylogaea oryzae]
MRNLAMALLLLAGLPALADVYKWKDADGRTHYSDRAAGAVGAERMHAQDGAAAGPPAIPAAQSAKPANPAEAVRQDVTLYTRPDCPYCKLAKADLRRRGVPYAERDIERSPRARKEFEAIGGRGVPILLVGSQRLDGYSKQGYGDALTFGGH